MLVAYEAGDGGYGIARLLKSIGVDCSLVEPLRPGLIKTDRRDSSLLAHGLKAGDLRHLWIPTEEMESAQQMTKQRRDLVRRRHTVLQKLHCLGARLGLPIALETSEHSLEDMTARGFSASDALMLYSLRDEHKQLSENIKLFDAQIGVYALHPEIAEGVRVLRAFRGIETTTAVAILTTVGDFRRFLRAEQFASYTGLTPVTRSSGSYRKTFSVPRNGGSLLRDYLLLAAGHYAHANAVPSSRLMRRRQDLPQNRLSMIEAFDNRLRSFADLLQQKQKPMAVIRQALVNKLAHYIWVAMTKGPDILAP